MGVLFIFIEGGASAVLDTSTSRPPRGFNTFDSYGDLNHSTVLTLGAAIKDQLLG